jgi:hypothetical protein
MDLTISDLTISREIIPSTSMHTKKRSNYVTADRKNEMILVENKISGFPFFFSKLLTKKVDIQLFLCFFSFSIACQITNDTIFQKWSAIGM